jgi:hypothetical protein
MGYSDHARPLHPMRNVHRGFCAPPHTHARGKLKKIRITYM